MRKILLIKNSLTVERELEDTLNELLLDVYIAKDEIEVFETLEKNPEIFLILINMIQFNEKQFNLIKSIKLKEEYTDIPIFSIIKEANRKKKEKLFKIGINDIILKPILKEELKTKINFILSIFIKNEKMKFFNKLIDEYIISSTTNISGVITDVSLAFCKISGYSKNELIGKNHNIVRHPDMSSSDFKDMWKTIQNSNTWKGEVKNLKKNGDYYWVNAIVSPILDEKRIIGYLSIREDITDKKRVYKLSVTDGLTSLYNRRYFNNISNSIFTKTLRNHDMFGFILLDIDNFKKYNDTYGHQKGDKVLVDISTSLRATFKRSNDIVFRLGGEEFGILLNVKTKEDALTLGELARKNIENLQIEHKNSVPCKIVTASFGISLISNEDLKQYSNLDNIYKITDDMLYLSKNKGKNMINFVALK